MSMNPEKLAEFNKRRKAHIKGKEETEKAEADAKAKAQDTTQSNASAATTPASSPNK